MPHHSYRFRYALLAKSNSYANPPFYVFGFDSFTHTMNFVAGAEGIEPSSAVLETDILPLNYAPILTVKTSVFTPSDPAVCVKIAQEYRKSSGNYYTFLIYLLQAKSYPHIVIFCPTVRAHHPYTSTSKHYTVIMHFLLAQVLFFCLQSVCIKGRGFHCKTA